MIRKQLMLFVIFCLLISAGPALADVAADPLNKGMTPARKDSRVQMVSQDVVIHLGGDWCRVEAKFLLYNRARGSAIMEVGFPTGYKDEIRELKVWQNGKSVKTKKSVEQEIMEPDKDPATYHWVLWNMRFAPGEKKSLQVNYRIKPRKNHDYYITAYRKFADSIAGDASGQSPAPDEIKRVIDGIVSYSSGYIMVTGASWYDSIEKATVTVQHPKGAGAIRWLDPDADFTVTPEGIRWQFSYIKPDFDVSVEFHNQWTIEEEIAVVKKAISVSEKKQGLNNHLRYLEQVRDCLGAGGCGTKENQAR